MGRCYGKGSVEAQQRTRSGSLSPNWAAWSRIWSKVPGGDLFLLLALHRIWDHWLFSGMSLKVLKIMPMQKQTCAGRWTRFKASVTTGVYYRRAGLGVTHSMEVATAILGAIVQARLFITPCVARLLGTQDQQALTIPCKVTSRCGSMHVLLILTPRGNGII